MKKFKVTVDGRTYSVEIEELGEIQAKQPMAAVVTTPANPSPAVQGAPAPAREDKAAAVTAPGGGGGVTEIAPMPGSVLEVKVQIGDQVRQGDVLLVLEAMKMENEIVASQDGTVTKILVNKGDNVNIEDPLLVLS